MGRDAPAGVAREHSPRVGPEFGQLRWALRVAACWFPKSSGSGCLVEESLVLLSGRPVTVQEPSCPRLLGSSLAGGSEKKKQKVGADLKAEVRGRRELKAEYRKDGRIDENHGASVRSDLGDRWDLQVPNPFLSSVPK